MHIMQYGSYDIKISMVVADDLALIWREAIRQIIGRGYLQPSWWHGLIG